MSEREPLILDSTIESQISAFTKFVTLSRTYEYMILLFSTNVYQYFFCFSSQNIVFIDFKFVFKTDCYENNVYNSGFCIN